MRKEHMTPNSNTEIANIQQIKVGTPKHLTKSTPKNAKFEVPETKQSAQSLHSEAVI